MNVGSLFAEIGGFDLGFERAGMSIAWQIEQDPFCRPVLERHFPAARRFERVEEVGAQNLCPVELICGGLPCQDPSPAGRGAGLDGARSSSSSQRRELRHRDRSGRMKKLPHQARGAVDLLVALVVDPLVDLLVDLVVGVISAATPLFSRHSADCGDSDFKRSPRHIEVGT